MTPFGDITLSYVEGSSNKDSDRPLVTTGRETRVSNMIFGIRDLT